MTRSIGPRKVMCQFAILALAIGATPAAAGEGPGMGYAAIPRGRLFGRRRGPGQVGQDG